MAGRPALADEDKAKMVASYFPPADLHKLRTLALEERRRESQMVVILVREALAIRDAKVTPNAS